MDSIPEALDLVNSLDMTAPMWTECTMTGIGQVSSAGFYRSVFTNTNVTNGNNYSAQINVSNDIGAQALNKSFVNTFSWSIMKPFQLRGFS